MRERVKGDKVSQYIGKLLCQAPPDRARQFDVLSIQVENVLYTVSHIQVHEGTKRDARWRALVENVSTALGWSSVLLLSKSRAADDVEYLRRAAGVSDRLTNPAAGAAGFGADALHAIR